MVNPSKTSCSDFSKSVMLISSVLLSVACLAGLIHVEFELSVHREMLKVLNQQKAEKFEPKERKLPVEGASDMKMLPSDSNKELPSFRYRRNTGTTSTISNSSKTVNHQELQLALSSLACSVQCPKGTRGKRGRPGHPGQPGKHGPAGPQGVRGFQGEPGIQGIQGLPGPKGDQGLEGPKGDPGKSISAPSIMSPPRSMVVNRTDTASFQCEAEGNPEPIVTWLKRNSSLPPSKRVAQSRAGLMITDVTSQDDGMYTCVAENILGAAKASATLTVQVGALITRKPLSTIVEEGQNVTLACEATGQPKPSVTWKKAVGHVPKDKYRVIDGNLTILNITRAAGGDYVCSAKNLLNEDSAFAQIMAVKKLKLISPPPVKLSVSSQTDVTLKCLAQGAIEIVWRRARKNLPQNHVLHQSGTLLLKSVTASDAGTYTCVARNFHRSIKANTVLEVELDTKSCSNIKRGNPGNSSGYYVIDPDGDGGVASFRVYCDMRDKGGVGVTVISHDSESRTHVANIPGCNNPGCYSKSVTYTGASTAQLAALTRASKNCEQFIKFECNNDVTFVLQGFAWWVSRDGRKMNYWGGAPAGSRMCACGVTNSCSNGKKCNCDYGSTDSGWREDSGSLTDKSALPVSQIKLGDLDDSREEGYHTLGKLKCYGVA